MDDWVTGVVIVAGLLVISMIIKYKKKKGRLLLFLQWFITGVKSDEWDD